MEDSTDKLISDIIKLLRSNKLQKFLRTTTITSLYCLRLFGMQENKKKKPDDIKPIVKIETLPCIF